MPDVARALARAAELASGVQLLGRRGWEAGVRAGECCKRDSQRRATCMLTSIAADRPCPMLVWRCSAAPKHSNYPRPHLHGAAKVAPRLGVLLGAVPAALILDHHLVQPGLAQVEASAAAVTAAVAGVGGSREQGHGGWRARTRERSPQQGAGACAPAAACALEPVSARRQVCTPSKPPHALRASHQHTHAHRKMRTTSRNLSLGWPEEREIQSWGAAAGGQTTAVEHRPMGGWVEEWEAGCVPASLCGTCPRGPNCHAARYLSAKPAHLHVDPQARAAVGGREIEVLTQAGGAGTVSER